MADCRFDVALNFPVDEGVGEVLSGLRVYSPRERSSAADIWEYVRASRVFINAFTPVDAGLLRDKGCLELIVLTSTGFDHVDVEAAAGVGVCVANQPEVITEAVAEYVVAAVLAALRGVVAGHMYTPRWAREGWPSHLAGFLVRGRSVGLLGAGRIGQSVAFKLAALGAGPFYYYSRSRKPGLEAVLGAKRLEPRELFSRSMILVNSLPLTGETRGLVTAGLLRLLPRGAVYVNVGRGGTEEPGAVEAVASEREDLYFVLDVHPEEPLPPSSGRMRLHGNPRVVMTPHIAGSSRESMTATRLLAAMQARDYLERGCVWNPVNGACRECPSQRVGLDEAIAMARRLLGV
ncbi:putative glyoxylate reductase [Aeropyrum pernix K1]|uniref:Glyoxylate reductase n=1 Tax=Aeropyrum pernix (strain ATCC 700893 / DSM 11879 / JCM 9820 / NBRC 100138 / K1) TaxID=272557 RepID=Q9YCJ2_AERPE|nr:2-hydroxyacid dehydrogenase [Aeropyrum pernix]BAA80255.2 putative glyoxylate reductase [Aeropyrum pernix K1]